MKYNFFEESLNKKMIAVIIHFPVVWSNFVTNVLNKENAVFKDNSLIVNYNKLKKMELSSYNFILDCLISSTSIDKIVRSGDFEIIYFRSDYFKKFFCNYMWKKILTLYILEENGIKDELDIDLDGDNVIIKYNDKYIKIEYSFNYYIYKKRVVNSLK